MEQENKKITPRNWKGGKSRAYGWKIALEVFPPQCSICESTNHLYLHHKHRNFYNNTIENLQIVCSKCHKTLHRNASIFPLFGKNNPMYGKHHSEITKNKMRIAKQRWQESGKPHFRHNEQTKKNMHIAWERRKLSKKR